MADVNVGDKIQVTMDLKVDYISPDGQVRATTGEDVPSAVAFFYPDNPDLQFEVITGPKHDPVGTVRRSVNSTLLFFKRDRNCWAPSSGANYNFSDIELSHDTEVVFSP